MADAPDWHAEIDEQIRHIVDDLDGSLSEPMEWHFTVEGSPDAQARVSERLGESVITQIVDMEVHKPDGTITGPFPVLRAILRGTPTPDELKAFADQVSAAAEAEGLSLEDVVSYDCDEDELFGWLKRDDAVWRLHHMTDTGVPEGTDLLWVFAIEANSSLQLQSLATTFSSLDGFREVEEDDSDDEGPLLFVVVNGKNDSVAAGACYDRVEELATRSGVEVLGMQFHDVDDDGDNA